MPRGKRHRITCVGARRFQSTKESAKNERSLAAVTNILVEWIACTGRDLNDSPRIAASIIKSKSVRHRVKHLRSHVIWIDMSAFRPSGANFISTRAPS
jgi:hypothetical protein